MVESTEPEIVESTEETTELEASEPETTAENPYVLYQVIDGGGNNVYFYFIDTGSANQGSEYNSCYNSCIENIL